jgi:hypothetical protein
MKAPGEFLRQAESPKTGQAEEAFVLFSTS